MASVTASIEVNVPVKTAYNQWTQFEEFPQFMDGVEEVKQLDETHLEWRAQIAGKEEHWKAEITEQKPDEIIAWQSTEGTSNGGRVTFQPDGPAKTRVQLDLIAEPHDMLEQAGTSVGLLDRQVKEDLKRFRDFIESRGAETGGWRGEVDGNGGG
jgi:uncharacterized membrane protein